MQENKLLDIVHSIGLKWRIVSLVVWDVIMIQLTSVCSILLRFDMSFNKVYAEYWRYIIHYAAINTVVTIGVFLVFHLYTSLWRFAGTLELANIVISCGCSAAFQFGGMRLLGYDMPRSYYLFYPFILIIITAASRFSYRFLRAYEHNHRSGEENSKTRTMVIGAGSAAAMLLTEITSSRYLNCEVPCLIDDNPDKQGSFLHGVPVIGGREKIKDAVEAYEIQEIIFAIPSLSARARKEIYDICKETGCKLKTVPGLYQLINNEVSVTQLREVEIEDLLGRAPVCVNMDSILSYVRDQVVLVTGGGGSIGSEICRQIAAHDPKQLIILDNYENNVYELQMALRRRYPRLDQRVLIASVQSRQRIYHIFQEYKPNLVFHAAAHKHVPLMEDSPCEAVKNNIIGTYNVAAEANRMGCQKMVMISTDKAVRPTNVMGASKRICEMMIQSFNHISDTEYVAVRFGNVLGSNGSVIPLFKEQIKEGGPVTVTHKDIIRYFMTIPEAVSLVLQAGAYAKGGEIFILDMGEPVKILDLAENLIRLSGLTPGVDIDIVFTGLRPGEKLYEELLIDDENKKETANSRIFIGQPVAFDERKFWDELETLKEMALNDSKEIRTMIKKIVPEYTYKM
ncbi:MAG: nucleoside-diphosphate sugar epimerase/dehydratase [Lachnospiraceae bacterium]|nr:nucleoside-diphosphate sugar epimerase/dehydratase [Lachnospiraceae bacterium]